MSPRKRDDKIQSLYSPELRTSQYHGVTIAYGVVSKTSDTTLPLIIVPGIELMKNKASSKLKYNKTGLV